MLAMIATVLIIQAPVAGPWIDVSHTTGKILADVSSRSRTGDMATVDLTIQRPDGFRTESRATFDCMKNVYSNPTSRHTTASGEVITSHSNMRHNAIRPIEPGMEPILSFACSGEVLDRPLITDREGALGPQTY